MHIAVQNSESSVSKASKHILPYKGTVVEQSFLNSRLRSWQQHLRHISPFLEAVRVWWTHLPGGYIFHDGDANEESHSEGPKLLHYRSATIKDVIERQSVTWKRLLQGKIELPTSKVYLYNAEGNPAGELIYPLQANSCHHGTRSHQGENSGDKMEGEGMGDSTGESTRDDIGESTENQEKSTGEEGTEVARGEGTGEDGTGDGTQDTRGKNTGDNQGESIEDENLRHMLSDKEREHGYADNTHVESENDECYDNEPIDEQDDQIPYQVMGKRNAAKQRNTKLKLSLDPTDDVEESACFKTKHAACVSKVLGSTDKVVKFDILRYQLKSTKKPSKALTQAHNKLLAELQSLIQVHKTSTEQELKQVEAAYFKQHASILTCNSCPEHAQLMKRYKLINKLLATWNIQL